MMARLGWPLLALVLVAGCANDPGLDDPDMVRVWANTASPVAVFLHGWDPLAQSYAQPDVYKDPLCPAIADDGTTLVITGGCTDSTGQAWFGSARVVRAGASDRDVTLDGYGHSSDAGDSRTSGTVAIRAQADGSHAFEVHVVAEGGMRTTVDYEGTVAGYYGDPVTIWSGHGTVAREGMVRPTGQVTATTVDQRLDSACSGESAAGTTTISAEGHTAVVTYDGATDCDADHSARWSFDGLDRGLVSGISCAASPGRTAGGAGLAGLLALALARAVARRRNSRPAARSRSRAAMQVGPLTNLSSRDESFEGFDWRRVQLGPRVRGPLVVRH
jgi:hypothetical protein